MFATSLSDNEVTLMKVCFIWEEDSYHATFSRVAAALDLGIADANRLILPKTHQLRSYYINTGPSCKQKMYLAFKNLQEHVRNGLNCSAFLGASKFGSNSREYFVYIYTFL